MPRSQTRKEKLKNKARAVRIDVQSRKVRKMAEKMSKLEERLLKIENKDKGEP